MNRTLFFGTRTIFIRAVPKIWCSVNGPLGIMEVLIAGRNGVVRVAKLGAGKSHLEWAV